MTTSTKEPNCMIPYNDLNGAADTLRNDGIILFPTDTLWSIGCDATNKKAIQKILKLKRTASPQPHDFELLVDATES